MKRKTKIYEADVQECTCKVYFGSELAATFQFLPHSDGFKLTRHAPRERYSWKEYISDILDYLSVVRKMY